MGPTPTQRWLSKQLAELFLRNGYVRRQNPKRLARDREAYKKGDEVRLVARTQRELAEIKRLLRYAGFAYGRPFRKAGQYALPIYGRDEVARFMEFIGAEEY